MKLNKILLVSGTTIVAAASTIAVVSCGNKTTDKVADAAKTVGADIKTTTQHAADAVKEAVHNVNNNEQHPEQQVEDKHGVVHLEDPALGEAKNSYENKYKQALNVKALEIEGVTVSLTFPTLPARIDLEHSTVEEIKTATVALEEFTKNALDYNQAVSEASAISRMKPEYEAEYAKALALAITPKPADKTIAIAMPIIPAKEDAAGKTSVQLMAMIHQVELFESSVVTWNAAVAQALKPVVETPHVETHVVETHSDSQVAAKPASILETSIPTAAMSNVDFAAKYLVEKNVIATDFKLADTFSSYSLTTLVQKLAGGTPLEIGSYIFKETGEKISFAYTPENVLVSDPKSPNDVHMVVDMSTWAKDKVNTFIKFLFDKFSKDSFGHRHAAHLVDFGALPAQDGEGYKHEDMFDLGEIKVAGGTRHMAIVITPASAVSASVPHPLQTTISTTRYNVADDWAAKMIENFKITFATPAPAPIIDADAIYN